MARFEPGDEAVFNPPPESGTAYAYDKAIVRIHGAWEGSEDDIIDAEPTPRSLVEIWYKVEFINMERERRFDVVHGSVLEPTSEK